MGFLRCIRWICLHLRTFDLRKHLVRRLVLGKEGGALLMTEDLRLILRHQAYVEVMRKIHLIGDVGD